MHKRQIPIFLITLMLIPFVNTVQAEGVEETDLEAKNLVALVDSVNETVTISWQNTNTNDYTILNELKTTNYSLYRSDEPLNSSNYQQAELIEDEIQACLQTDALENCKNKMHVVVYNTPANTDGSYYYGVISTLENGSIISNLSIGNATLSEPINEFGSPITSPYNLQASYTNTHEDGVFSININNTGTTHLSWIDVSQVNPAIDSNHTTSIWSHSSVAQAQGFQLDSSFNNNTNLSGEAAFTPYLIANVSSDVNSYEIIHPPNTDQVTFYTVLHTINGETDTRLLSGNSLTQGLVEDNTGSTITGTLSASFNSSTSITSLDWNGSIIEDVNHTLHIWRSSSAIDDIFSDEVHEIAQLPANATQYNLSVEPDYSGLTYYLITLSDELGNHQSNIPGAPNASLFEYTLTTNQNIVTDLSATFSDGVTQLVWTDLVNHSEASYQIWRSTTGQINSTTFNTPNVSLLATVEAGVEHYNNTFGDGVSEYSWYAITTIASFGTGNITYSQTNLSLTLNSLSAYVAEDTKKPTAPTVLNAIYLVNGTTQISWNGGSQEQGTTWNIYRNLYNDLDQEPFWVLVEEKENDGTSLHTVFVDTTAQAGEVVIPVYAIEGVDIFGNSIDFEDWSLSAPVREDRQAPFVQLQLYNSQMDLEASRWFSGGEAATFSNLETDNYTIKFVGSNDSSIIDYTISTESGNKNMAFGVAEINMAVSDQIANITISFTVTDLSGNTMSSSAVFCTACLIQITVEDPAEEESKEITEDKKETDDTNERILIGACILFLLIVVLLLSRNSKTNIPTPTKTLTGLPVKSEDKWISNYINKKEPN